MIGQPAERGEEMSEQRPEHHREPAEDAEEEVRARVSRG